jgi:hypothetical protein
VIAIGRELHAALNLPLLLLLLLLQAERRQRLVIEHIVIDGVIQRRGGESFLGRGLDW